MLIIIYYMILQVMVSHLNHNNQEVCCHFICILSHTRRWWDMKKLRFKCEISFLIYINCYLHNLAWYWTKCINDFAECEHLMLLNYSGKCAISNTETLPNKGSQEHSFLYIFTPLHRTKTGPHHCTQQVQIKTNILAPGCHSVFNLTDWLHKQLHEKKRVLTSK